MKSSIIFLGYIVLACGVTLRAQTSQPPSSGPADTKAGKDGKNYYAIEKLVMDPLDIGIDAQRSIDGMVINVKSPVKVVANDREQSSLVMSSEFREKNLRYAALGMHSWLSVSYKIAEEKNKQVTLWVMEFDTPENARRFGGVQMSNKEEAANNRDVEFKGSVFYQFIHGAILLKVTWPDPKTSGVDKVVAAYKSRVMTY